MTQKQADAIRNEFNMKGGSERAFALVTTGATDEEILAMIQDVFRSSFLDSLVKPVREAFRIPKRPAA